MTDAFVPEQFPGDLSAITYQFNLEQDLLPIPGDAEPAGVTSVHYPWSGMDLDQKAWLVERAAHVIASGGELPDIARHSLEQCISSARAELERRTAMDEYAPPAIRRIGRDKRIAFEGVVSRFRYARKPTEQ